MKPKKNFLQQGRGKTKNRKIRHIQKFEPNFFFIFTWHLTRIRSQKALHTQLHSDPRVYIGYVFIDLHTKGTLYVNLSWEDTRAFFQRERMRDRRQDVNETIEMNCNEICHESKNFSCNCWSFKASFYINSSHFTIPLKFKKPPKLTIFKINIVQTK